MGQTEVRGFVHVCFREPGEDAKGVRVKRQEWKGPGNSRPRGEVPRETKNQSYLFLFLIFFCVDSQIICFKKFRNFQKFSFILTSRNRFQQ